MLFNTKLPFKLSEIAIVGNGPCEIGTGNGEVIDSFPHVARFNDFSIEEKHHNDYGKRVSIWVSSFNSNYYDPSKIFETEFDHVFCPLPVKGGIRSEFYNINLNKKFLEVFPDFFCMSPEEFSELHELDQLPSTGEAFLWLLFKRGGKIPKENVFGFDFHAKKNNQHYYNNFNKTTHDPKKERMIYDMVTE